MLDIEQFKDKHKGEEVIVVCNGPGLKNIPFAFIESRTNFVLNFFAGWVPFIQPDYWVVLDALCFKAAEFYNGTVKFVKVAQAREFKGECIKHFGLWDENNVCFWEFYDPIPGFRVTKKFGTDYSTSAIAAAHLAVWMGARSVLLIGFNCTYGMGLYDELDNFQGLSRIPHFYDKRKHFTGYSGMWDEHFKLFAEWAKEKGTEIINLSIPTESKLLKRGDYREYWQPEENRNG